PRWSRSRSWRWTGAEALPGPAATPAAPTSAAAREAAAEAARPGGRRCKGGAEPGGEVADRHRGGPAPQVSLAGDPVQAARLGHRLGHRHVGRLEHPLGDAERDAVDEQPLPERQRRLLEAREVLQVAAEGVPALGLDRGVATATAPELATGRRAEQDGGVDE